MRRRVMQRAAQSSDVSEAGAAVLEHQLAARKPFAKEEMPMVVNVDAASEDGVRRGLAEIGARLAAREEALAPH